MLGTQRRTVLSLEAEATRWPEGENWTEMTASLCPSKRYARIWGFMFQIITQESIEPVAAGGRSTGEWTKQMTTENILHRRWNERTTANRCSKLSAHIPTNTNTQGAFRYDTNESPCFLSLRLSLGRKWGKCKEAKLLQEPLLSSPIKVLLKGLVYGGGRGIISRSRETRGCRKQRLA